MQHAVDLQQAGADAVADGDMVHVLFIGESDRSIYSTYDDGGWQPATLRVDGIDGSWVHGNVYVRPEGVKVYGYVYDAGSRGGAGMNRFDEVVPTPLPARQSCRALRGKEVMRAGDVLEAYPRRCPEGFAPSRSMSCGAGPSRRAAVPDPPGTAMPVAGPCRRGSSKGQNCELHQQTQRSPAIIFTL